MRKLLIAAAAGLMTLSALPAAAAAATAAAPQERPYMQDNMRGPDRGRNDNNWNNGRGPDRNDRNDHRGDERYGRWDNSWGMRPSAPPRHWSRQNDWYRHVRACSQRYRSYNPRTDTFVVSRGRTAICRL
ncbi:MAG: hypothetical protein JWR59_1616 [Brevundimonas sp.]|nr:hypothetical protein [Brevundimonas sp.]